MTRSGPMDVVTGLRNTRRSMGDGTLQGRVRNATPYRRGSAKRVPASQVVSPGDVAAIGEWVEIEVPAQPDPEGGEITFGGVIRRGGWGDDPQTFGQTAYYDLHFAIPLDGNPDGGATWTLTVDGEPYASGPIDTGGVLAGVVPRIDVARGYGWALEIDGVALDDGGVTMQLVDQQAARAEERMFAYHVRTFGSDDSIAVYRWPTDDPADREEIAWSSLGSWSATTWHWIRARIDGDRIRAKAWTGDEGDEPSGWDIDVTDPAFLPRSGFVGFGPTHDGPTSGRQVDVFEANGQRTDFSEYPADVVLSGEDWHTVHETSSPDDWTVQESSTIGGQLVQRSSSGGAHWMAWTTPGRLTTVDVKARVRATSFSNSMNGVVLACERGPGE